MTVATELARLDVGPEPSVFIDSDGWRIILELPHDDLDEVRLQVAQWMAGAAVLPIVLEDSPGLDHGATELLNLGAAPAVTVMSVFPDLGLPRFGTAEEGPWARPVEKTALSALRQRVVVGAR